MNGDGGHVEPVGVNLLVQRKRVETIGGELDEAGVTYAVDEARLRLLGRRSGCKPSVRPGKTENYRRTENQKCGREPSFSYVQHFFQVQLLHSLRAASLGRDSGCSMAMCGPRRNWRDTLRVVPPKLPQAEACATFRATRGRSESRPVVRALHVRPPPPPHTFWMNIKTKELGRFIVL